MVSIPDGLDATKTKILQDYIAYDLTRDALVGFRWFGVSFRWYCGVGGLVVGH